MAILVDIDDTDEGTEVRVTDDVVTELEYARFFNDSVGANDEILAVIIPRLVILNVRSLDSKTIRVTFDRPITIAGPLLAQILDVANYIPLAVTQGAAPISVLSVTVPVGLLEPRFIQLAVTEMTDGAVYELRLVENKFVAADDGGANTNSPTEFSGKGVIPNLVGAFSVDKNTVRVKFDEAMADNAPIRDAARYVWTGGLATTSVESVIGDTVIIRTTDQAPGVAYDLTVVSDLISVVIDDDAIIVTDFTLDENVVPPNAVTEDGIPVTEEAAWVTESNPTSSLTILGAQCPYWTNVRLGRLMGTPPDINELRNLADLNNANVVADAPDNAPHLVDLSGVEWAEYDGIDDRLETSDQNELWAVGETDVFVWATVIIDVYETAVIVDFWDSDVGSTGIAIRLGATGIRARLLTTAGVINLLHPYADTGKHLIGVGFDGVNLKIYIDGIEVKSGAHTGTMSNACTAVTEGSSTTGGNRVEGKIHEVTLAVGPLSGGDRADIDAYKMNEIGL